MLVNDGLSSRGHVPPLLPPPDDVSMTLFVFLLRKIPVIFG